VNGFTVIECDDAQVALKFCDPYPVPNAAIIGLNLLAVRFFKSQQEPVRAILPANTVV
jgi:hypothetical protein